MNSIRYIYRITCLLDNKIYIGKRTCLKLPDNKYMGSGLLIGRYIRKYGVQNFEKELIEECGSLEELNIREKFWIKELNSIFPAGLNISEGGEKQCDLRFHPDRERIIKQISNTLKGQIISPETRKKISVANKGRSKPKFTEEHKNNIRKARALQGGTNIGRKFSEEWRSNLSKAHIGLVSNRKGKKSPQYLIDSLKRDVICPYCNKKGKVMGMIKWHFNNCKNKHI